MQSTNFDYAGGGTMAVTPAPSPSVSPSPRYRRLNTDDVELDHHGADVRERLLKVSAEYFARDGFNRTSVREICRAAKANVASIRYYFGSKLGLYRELLVESVRIAIQQHPMPELIEGESGEAGIRRWVEHLLNLKLRDGFEEEIMCRLISHELHEPSPALDEVVDLLFAPFHHEMEKAISKLLEGRAPQPICRHLSLQLTALCFQYAQRRHVLQRLQFRLPSGGREADDLIDYVTRFFIAGARAVV